METNLESELSSFPGREAALRKITRYSIMARMIYRTTLWTHARRVAKIVTAISPLIKTYYPEFDEVRARAIALVHDDPEMITGDVQAGNKSKMSRDELAELERLERAAVEELSHRFPERLGGYVYRDLLLSNIDRKDLEAQAVQFADKLDAFGEALHEIFSGNRVFATEPETKYGRIVLPFVLYSNYFGWFAVKFPRLAFLTEGPERVIELQPDTDWMEIALEGGLQSHESLREPTGNQIYDYWKSLVVDEEESYLLTTEVE